MTVVTIWRFSPWKPRVLRFSVRNMFFWRIQANLDKLFLLTRFVTSIQTLQVIILTAFSACSDVKEVDVTNTLQWRHNEHDDVSNHQPHDCLLNGLFWRKSKKTSKLRVTGLCVGNSPVTGEFHAQMASDAENVSIWLRHHVSSPSHGNAFHIIWAILFVHNRPCRNINVIFPYMSFLIIKINHCLIFVMGIPKTAFYIETSQGANININSNTFLKWKENNKEKKIRTRYFYFRERFIFSQFV